MFFNIKRALSMLACASALALACAPSAFAADATTTLITLDGGNQSLSSTTLSADDSADELASAIKDQALATQAVSVGKIVICLDPGHGGSDGGASGNGVTEADANLAIAQACKTRLESYGIFKVVMTRTSDSTVGLHDRVPYAQSQGADLFVSIHNNSSTSSGAHGSEQF